MENNETAMRTREREEDAAIISHVGGEGLMEKVTAGDAEHENIHYLDKGKI